MDIFFSLHDDLVEHKAIYILIIAPQVSLGVYKSKLDI
jgi:hypothetical protein